MFRIALLLGVVVVYGIKGLIDARNSWGDYLVFGKRPWDKDADKTNKEE